MVKPSGPERESGVKIWLAWLLCIRVQGERLVPTMGYTPTATQRQAKEAAAEPARHYQTISLITYLIISM